MSLNTPFLLIFGQEFLKTRPCLDFGGVPRFTGRTGQTGPTTGQTGRTGQTAAVAGQTGRLVVGLLLLVLPPECFCALRDLLWHLLFRSFITNNYILPLG